MIARLVKELPSGQRRRSIALAYSLTTTTSLAIGSGGYLILASLRFADLLCDGGSQDRYLSANVSSTSDVRLGLKSFNDDPCGSPNFAADKTGLRADDLTGRWTHFRLSVEEGGCLNQPGMSSVHLAIDGAERACRVLAVDALALVDSLEATIGLSVGDTTHGAMSADFDNVTLEVE